MHQSSEHLGLLTKTFLPAPEKPMGGITKTVRSIREALIGWADDIPFLNIASGVIRLIV